MGDMFRMVLAIGAAMLVVTYGKRVVAEYDEAPQEQVECQATEEGAQ